MQLICKPGSVEDNHLSSHVCCQADQADIGWHGRIALCVPATLQPTGFTSLPRHRGRLWAFTPLLSPLPSVATSCCLRWRYRFCGTFPRVTPGCR